MRTCPEKSFEKSDKRCSVRMHGKEGFKRVLEGSDGVVALSKKIRLEQGKVD